MPHFTLYHLNDLLMVNENLVLYINFSFTLEQTWRQTVSEWT